MWIKRFSDFYLPVFWLVSLFCLPEDAIACSCKIPPPCIAYSHAAAVFTGKLQRLVSDKEIIYAHFEVERVFKGTVKNIEAVGFLSGGCEKSLQVGGKYFVYKEDANYPGMCNRTHLLWEKDSDFIYASGLSEKNPVFTISGTIDGLSESETKEAQVFIEESKNRYEALIDKDGSFTFKAAKKGTYYVKILLPFDAAAQVTSGNLIYNVKQTRSENRTIIEYETDFKSNGCDSREIEFNKNYETASSSTLRGNVVDESGNPVRSLKVYAYPQTRNQNFTGWDFEVARTNETGEQVFNKLSSGNYIPGINMGKTPDFSLPYPETYFHGKTDFR